MRYFKSSSPRFLISCIEITSSISYTENSEGRLDSTKLSEGLCCRKFGAIELLSSEVFPSENWCYRTAVFSVANSDNEPGRFDTCWCSRTVALSEHEGSEGRLDSTKFSEGCRFRKSATIGAAAPSRPQDSGSIAPFSEGLASTKLVLPNRFGTPCKYGQQPGAVR